MPRTHHYRLTINTQQLSRRHVSYFPCFLIIWRSLNDTKPKVFLSFGSWCQTAAVLRWEQGSLPSLANLFIRKCLPCITLPAGEAASLFEVRLVFMACSYYMWTISVSEHTHLSTPCHKEFKPLGIFNWFILNEDLMKPLPALVQG